MNAFQVRCERCGKPTSQSYAKLHDGQCKKCYTGKSCYEGRRRSESGSGRTAAESTSEFRGIEADLDNCPY
jgi:hypothetical protein